LNGRSPKSRSIDIAARLLDRLPRLVPRLTGRFLCLQLSFARLLLRLNLCVSRLLLRLAHLQLDLLLDVARLGFRLSHLGSAILHNR
jgi:hypothetical protein